MDKYKMTAHKETTWDVSEWQSFAWTLGAFLLFILINVFWETMKEAKRDARLQPLEKMEQPTLIIPMREQLFLFLHKTGSYALLFGVLLWNYGKEKFKMLKHKIA